MDMQVLYLMETQASNAVEEVEGTAELRLVVRGVWYSMCR
jgi:hypothetical protein